MTVLVYKQYSVMVRRYNASRCVSDHALTTLGLRWILQRN